MLFNISLTTPKC